MGQQQLLLIVLGIVIVGVAIAVAITAYSENSVKSNWDAILQDALRISSDAQVWKGTPQVFGGSPDGTKGDQADYSEVDFFDFAYSAAHVQDDGDCYENQNGQYVLFAFRRGLGVLAINVMNQNMVGLWVTGGLEADIELYGAGWNPVRGGIGANGGSKGVRSHKRCGGGGGTKIEAEVDAAD